MEEPTPIRPDIAQEPPKPKPRPKCAYPPCNSAPKPSGLCTSCEIDARFQTWLFETFLVRTIRINIPPPVPGQGGTRPTTHGGLVLPR